MSDLTPLRIAVRFPPYASAEWRARCVASLSALGQLAEVANAGLAVESADVVLDLSTERIDPYQLTVPRKLGYWTFIYGARPERIEPGLQEFTAGGRAAYARLVRLEHQDRGTVLREGTVKVVGHSLKATRERLLQVIVDWPARVLQEHLAQTPHVAPTRIQFRDPGAIRWLYLEALRPLALIRNVSHRLLQEITREHWTVGVIDSPIQQVCRSLDPASVHWLKPPVGGFLADPFGLTLEDGRVVILAEALSWRDGRGRIVAFEWQPDNSQGVMEDVFDFPHHASYPHLIQDEDAIYCIPETIAQRQVLLYRAVAFPSHWALETVLLEDFPGADPTVCFFDDRWWLFCGNHDDQDETKLYLFHAARLRGPWLPHALNPVKCDLRSSRPGGSIFTMANELYRPSQDCSVTYGGAVVLNKIERLTPTEFVERPFRKLAPARGGPCPDGFHTLSAAGNLTLIDGKRHQVSAAAAIASARALRQKLNRQAGTNTAWTHRERL
jgi:hypothetical protein